MHIFYCSIDTIEITILVIGVIGEKLNKVILMYKPFNNIAYFMCIILIEK